MIHRIADNMDWDFYQTKKTHKETKKFYISRTRAVETDGVPIKIKINDEAYDKLFKRTALKEKIAVLPELAAKWVEDNIVGGITKEMLDEQRFKEVNSLDMM